MSFGKADSRLQDFRRSFRELCNESDIFEPFSTNLAIDCLSQE